MYRNRRNRMSSRTRKVVIGVTAAVVIGGGWAISTGVSGASENNSVACAGFDQAIQNNLNFIADQQAHPTGVSAANIQNRQQVIDNINVTKKAAGCTEAAPSNGGGAVAAPPAQQQTKPPTTQPAAPPAQNGNAGDVVCKGSTVTLSGTGGAPAASSNAFPIGTSLKVTNTDNNKSITVKVTEPSGSCVLLNDAAFNQIHEDGKLLIRHAIIERVG